MWRLTLHSAAGERQAPGMTGLFHELLWEEIMNGNEGGVMLEKLKMTVFSLDIQDSAAESCFQSQH